MSPVSPDFFVHCFFLSFVIGILLSLLFKFKIIFREKTKNVCIVVLGDIGHSPRMQYHASSFLKLGYYVHLIGYAGSELLPELINNPDVKVTYLSPPYDLNDKLTSTVAYGIKVIYQSINLLLVLITNCQSSLIIVQNPPAIPTIPICSLYCLLVRIELVIDWHNYGCSIMALKSGENSFIVKLARRIEFFFGARAHKNFCVTKAMQKDLRKTWNIRAEVLYDRPKEEFRPISLEQKHELFEKICKEYPESLKDSNGCNKFTKLLSNGTIEWREDRPGLIVSSTSWTPDEDFSLLLDALQEYEAKKSSDEQLRLPNLICIITGKGPLKEFYSAIIKERKYRFVSFEMPWLDHRDYAKLLASSDLGVCLHTSSSGLDLPMKVIDMFGCGLPVCSYKFKSLNELVRHEENSFIFSSSKELSDQIQSWFSDFPNNKQQQLLNKQFKKDLEIFQELRWHENWVDVVIPTLALN